MQVNVSINEQNFYAVAEKIEKAKEFLLPDSWVHLDISDGIFTKTRTWNNPEDLLTIKTSLNLEAHLMVENPEGILRDWLKGLRQATTGKIRVIVHFEVMSEPAYILQECKNIQAEVGLALNTNTSPELISVYLKSFNEILILAVMPGPSGQVLQPKVLDKVIFIRSKNKDVIIEVDGGIMPLTARAAKNAGASSVVSSSYIWGHPSPKAAYEELSQIG